MSFSDTDLFETVSTSSGDIQLVQRPPDKTSLSGVGNDVAFDQEQEHNSEEHGWNHHHHQASASPMRMLEPLCHTNTDKPAPAINRTNSRRSLSCNAADISFDSTARSPTPEILERPDTGTCDFRSSQRESLEERSDPHAFGKGQTDEVLFDPNPEDNIFDTSNTDHFHSGPPVLDPHNSFQSKPPEGPIPLHPFAKDRPTERRDLTAFHPPPNVYDYFKPHTPGTIPNPLYSSPPQPSTNPIPNYKPIPQRQIPLHPMAAPPPPSPRSHLPPPTNDYMFFDAYRFDRSRAHRGRADRRQGIARTHKEHKRMLEEREEEVRRTCRPRVAEKSDTGMDMLI